MKPDEPETLRAHIFAHKSPLTDVMWVNHPSGGKLVKIKTKMPEVAWTTLPISDDLRRKSALRDEALDLIGSMSADELLRFIESRKPRDERKYDPHDCIAAVVNKYNADFCSEDRRP